MTPTKAAEDVLVDLIERALPFVKDRPGTPPLVLIAEMQEAIDTARAALTREGE